MINIIFIIFGVLNILSFIVNIIDIRSLKLKQKLFDAKMELLKTMWNTCDNCKNKFIIGIDREDISTKTFYCPICRNGL
jgi:hypothetical protein